LAKRCGSCISDRAAVAVLVEQRVSVSRAFAMSPSLASSAAMISRASVESGSSSSSSVALSSAGPKARARIASSTARRATCGSRSSRGEAVVDRERALDVAALRGELGDQELEDRVGEAELSSASTLGASSASSSLATPAPRPSRLASTRTTRS
jgi:hypothetical protein